MGDLDEDMAMEGGCCTPVRDDNVLMALMVYKPWASKVKSRRSSYHMPIMAPHHPLDGCSQGLMDPTHGYWSDALMDI